MIRTTILALTASLFLLGSAIAYGAETPAAATEAKAELVHVATCNDGKELYKATNQHIGACRGHGGVKTWADGSAVKAKGRKSEYR